MAVAYLGLKNRGTVEDRLRPDFNLEQRGLWLVRLAMNRLRIPFDEHLHYVGLDEKCDGHNFCNDYGLNFSTSSFIPMAHCIFFPLVLSLRR